MYLWKTVELGDTDTLKILVSIPSNLPVLKNLNTAKKPSPPAPDAPQLSLETLMARLKSPVGYGVSYILSLGAPLKIVRSIIQLVAIFVVDDCLILYLWHEMGRYKPMHHFRHVVDTNA